MGALPGDLKTQQLENQPSLNAGLTQLAGPVPASDTTINTTNDRAGTQMPFGPGSTAPSSQGGSHVYDPSGPPGDTFSDFKPSPDSGGHEQNIPPAPSDQVSTGPPVPIDTSIDPNAFEKSDQGRG